MTTQKKPAKVMDAVHPVGAAASATSRPIITSRTVLKTDPMLNVSDQSDIGVSSDEQPSGEPSQKPDASTPGDTPLMQGVNALASSDDSSMHGQASTDEAASNSALAEQPDEKVPSETEAEAVNEKKPVLETARKKIEPPTPSLKHDAAETDTTDADADTDAKVEQDESKDTDAPSLSAHEAELERHIAAGTYAVPIDTARRRKRTMLLITVGTVIVLALILNVLLDLNDLSLPSLPHTNLFG